jgi:hypothetical protein
MDQGMVVHSITHVYRHPICQEEEFLRKKMRLMGKGLWEVKEWLDREYKLKNFGDVMDRVRECLTEFFQTTMELEPHGKEILEEFTIKALAAVEQVVHSRLAGKIVKFGIQKGIVRNDFLILRAYHMASTKDWNGYIQINTELKWRHTKNMNVIKESRFSDLYVKAEELKRFCNMNEVVDRRRVTQRKTDEVNKFDQRTSLVGTMLVEQDYENAIINAGQLSEEAKEQKSFEFETGKIQVLRYYIEARFRCQDRLKFNEGLEDWLPVLYNIGGRNFENCWL